MPKQIIECVPNFSEGVDRSVISQITTEIEKVEGVKLLHVDAGKDTNRTVVTIAGEPQAVVDAAFAAIKKASEMIDMRKHKGAHPRMGATDVCPLVPVSGISMEETVQWAIILAKRVGTELKIPVYLYEAAQPDSSRNNLSVIRAGEYEGFEEKMKRPEWKPDYGPSVFNATAGATVIGARDFLIAYNVNLNTKSTRLANRIAFDVREAGRVIREGNPFTGKIMKDSSGEDLRQPGTLKSVKAIGWYIEEYGIAQISMNLTNLSDTSLHKAFDEVCLKAAERGLRVTGSELVGVVPLNSLLEAGKYYLLKQGRSIGVSEKDLIHIAIESLGLNAISPFIPEERIIEYLLDSNTDKKLVDRSVTGFVDETASDSPAPGGGSVSALCGALGAALGAMMANLSADKRGWEERVEEFSYWAALAQEIKKEMLHLVDEDTASFNGIMSAFAMPKDSDEEKSKRAAAVEAATLYATEIPYKSMQTAFNGLDMLRYMVDKGNPNGITDAGVGVLCMQTAIRGCYFNVMVNANALKDKKTAATMRDNAKTLLEKSMAETEDILTSVEIALHPH